MNLKPQDLVVALKIFTLRNVKWNQRHLAQSLSMSLSEINGAIKRSIRAGLMIRGDRRNDAPQSVPYALQEFITHGVRYVFFVEKGVKARGVPSGLIGAKLGQSFANEEESDVLVWPFSQGKVRGVGIKPLYNSIPKVIEKEENRHLYTLLSLVDVIREGRSREREIATEEISKILKSGPSHV